MIASDPGNRRSGRRPTTLRLVVASVILAGALTGLERAAHACSCPEPEPPEVAAEEADAVFAGEIVEFDEPEPDAFDDRTGVVAVHSVWVGEVAEETVLSTAADQGLCGVEPAVGEEYLVYARAGDDGTLTTDLCTRTTELDRADDDLAALGEPVDPRPTEPGDGSTGTTSGPSVVLAVALWAGAAAGTVAVVVAITTPRWRRPVLFVAAALFLPIGVLGIFSVGALFLVAALGCVIAAIVNPGGQSATSAPPST